MSLYAKAWLFVAWAVLVLVTFPVWLPLLQSLFGPSGTIIGIIFWISHGFIALFLFSCPDCGQSLFRTGGGLLGATHLSPNRKCSDCGRDHSA